MRSEVQILSPRLFLNLAEDGLIADGKLGCYRIGSGRGVIRVGEGHLADFLKAAEPRAPKPPAPPIRLKHLRL